MQSFERIYWKETKAQFARDDPAFLVLLAALLIVSTVSQILTSNEHMQDAGNLIVIILLGRILICAGNPLLGVCEIFAVCHICGSHWGKMTHLNRQWASHVTLYMYIRWGLWWPRVSGTCPTSSWWSPPWTQWSRTWSGDSVLTSTSMPSSPSLWSCISSSCLCTTPSLVSVFIVELSFTFSFTFHFLEREIFFATLLGNSLWLLALSYYIYITFLGYSSLNMLTRFSWTKTNIYNNKYMYNLLLGPISS